MVTPLTTDHLQSIGLQTCIPQSGESGSASAATNKKSSSSEWPSSKVRQTYIDFFVKKHGHRFVPSSPVVPHGDPTLLFINAGMNQFKPMFLGQIDPSHPWMSPTPMKSAANSQKCIRAGGKHNDLEDVGFDVYHHTCFEMLGNWSFGDYFKEKSIDMAWELLTKVYKLPEDRLYATYYGGDPKLPDVACDTDARDLWLRYLPPHKVIASNAKDNFWEMGETGPCGPCSELHFDRIGGRDASKLVNMDDPDVLEIWNLVFMQFNREKDGSLKVLPAPCVDTGMGLERVVSCLNDVRSNYDTDIFAPYFAKIKDLCSTKDWDCPTYSGLVGKDDKEGLDMAYRVIADHIRTLTIALSDGATPDAKGRGSVLRLILRRACRYGKRFLRAPDGFFSQLVPVVVESLGEAFPDLKNNWQDVQALIAAEEAQFLRTLHKGELHFAKIADSLPKGTKKFPGSDIFLLATTYGFPSELTEVMAKEKGLELDTEGYGKEMKNFQESSRKKKTDTGKEIKLEANETHELEVVKKIALTKDDLKYEWDAAKGTGNAVKAKVVAIWNGKKFSPQGIREDEELGIVFDKTPAYAESGGQCADKATVSGKGFTFDVSHVKAYAGYVVHTGKMEFGTIKVGDDVSIEVDYERRSHVAKNHTATHILNFALRQVLGAKVDQQGSSVKEDTFYFDFNANNKIDDTQLQKIEDICNEYIQRKAPVYSQECAKDDALAINGLRAMFTDKYGAKVRVVSVGQDIKSMLSKPKDPMWAEKNSVEFCGGTHVNNSQDIYRFVILSEEPVAKGVRRITACTGMTATSQAAIRATEIKLDLTEAKSMSGALLDAKVALLRARLGEDNSMSLIFKRQALKDADALKEVALKASKGDAKKLLETAKKEAEAVTLETLIDGKSGTKLGVWSAPASLNADMKAVGAAMEILVKKFPTIGLCILAPSAEGKMATVAQVPKTLSSQISAKAVLEAVWKLSNGKGGGSPMKAQGTASDSSKLKDCIQAAFKVAGV